MNAQADRSSYFRSAGAARGVLPLLITGIAVVLFSTAGLARMMGWGPNLTADRGDISELDPTAPAPSKVRANARCPECGVIVSMRAIEGHDEGAAAGYEFTVRMADGSSRVIDDANPGRWRTGERLIVIGGVKPLNR